MNAVVHNTQAADFYVADLQLADWGRKEIAIAETEKTVNKANAKSSVILLFTTN